MIFLDESQHQQCDFSFEKCFILHTECFPVLAVSMFLRQVLVSSKIVYFYSKLGGLSHPNFFKVGGFKIDF